MIFAAAVWPYGLRVPNTERHIGALNRLKMAATIPMPVGHLVTAAMDPAAPGLLYAAYSLVTVSDALKKSSS